MLRRIVILLALALFSGLLPQAFAGEELPRSGRQYVTMADGVELAAWVQFPKGWDGRPLPAVLEYDGYSGGSAPSYFPQFIDVSDYVVVHAGVRGTNCSGGRFQAFSDVSAEDGATLVEWVASQPWSDGDVGMYGHSYSATMAVMTAAKRPPSLRAITIDGVMDDLYRDLVYPGGVSNSGFPILWLAAARPLQEWEGGTLAAATGESSDCRDQIASRPPENPWESPYLHGLAGMEDNDWWYVHSLRSAIGNVEVPIQILGQHQDDQTLARGNAMLFDRVRHDRKQLLLSNGDHNSWWISRHHEVLKARTAWLDHYVRGIKNGADRDDRVRVFLETHRVQGGLAHTGEVSGDSFPLPGTRWTRFYVDAGGALSTDVPDAAGSDVFLHGTRRHVSDPGAVSSPEGSYAGQDVFLADGPDQLRFRSAPAKDVSAVAGPLVATLHATVPAGDAEFVVRVGTEDPEGNVSWMQRGYLKASHRAVDEERSWYDGDVMYRPWRPHTNPQLTTPNQPVQLDVEVWPTSFVLRPGHRLVMTVAAPALQEGFNTFQPRTAPQPVTIHRGPEYPSHLLVPIVAAPADLGPELPCGAQISVKCGKPAALTP